MSWGRQAADAGIGRLHEWEAARGVIHGRGGGCRSS